MEKDGLLFANAVAKSKENTLFSEERLNRMTEAKTLGDGVKILIEAGYGGGLVPEFPEDYEKILSAEESEVLDFVKKSALKNAGFECFFLQVDYFNAKALLKANYRSSANIPLKSGGFIPVADMKERILKDTPSFGEHLDRAIKEVRSICDSELSPRAIDTIIDKAMYKDIKDRLSARDADKYVKQYFEGYADCLNADSFVRSARIKASKEFFASNVMPLGTISEKELSDIYPDVDKLIKKLQNSGYASFADKISPDSLTVFDTARDDYLLDIFRANRGDIFSVAPIMGYYVAKMNEIKTIRVVLVSIKNKIATEEVKKRLRKMYA